MNRKRALVLLAFFSLAFSSCTIFSKQYDIPEYDSYKFRSELGQVNTSFQFLISEERYNRLNSYFQYVFPYRYENYCVWISIADSSYLSEDFNNDEDTTLYMYIEECRIVLSSDNVIDLLDTNDITVNYSYTGRDNKTRAPPKTLRNVQPQYTEDGRKTLYLESLENGTGDEVWVKFYAKIPSFASSLRLEFTLTVVWENLGEVKTRQNLLFKKKTKKTFQLTV